MTDSSAQFLQTTFPGHELVSVIPFHIRMNGKFHTDSREFKVSRMPVTLADAGDLQLTPPQPEEFQAYFSALSRIYDDILVILVSSHLSGIYSQALEAAESFRGPANVILVDSQSAAAGLGLIVQAAAAAAAEGLSGVEIYRLVRGLIPHTYAAFCTQSLSYLSGSGQLDPEQAVVGELIGLTPFFMLENGWLTPVQKIRSPRHMVDLLYEYISEFSDLKNIALIQGIPPFEQEARSLKERLNTDFPHAVFSEHLLNASLAMMLGPRCFGIVAVENDSPHNRQVGIE